MRKIPAASIFVLTFCLFVYGQNPNISSCPVILLQGPASVVKPGETTTFTAIVKDVDLEKVKYVWSVSNGKIIEGQGTPSITVEISANSSIYATVEIKDLPEGCPNVFTETGFGDPVPEAVLIEEISFSNAKLDSTKFEKLLVSLKNDSASTAYIIIYANKKATKNREQKEKQIREYLSVKKISLERIIIVNGGEEKSLVRLWLVPAGARPPIS